MNTEIHHADSRYRRNTLLTLTGAVIIAAVGFLAAQDWLRARVIALTPQQAIAEIAFWLSLATFACGLCLFALGAHAWTTAARSVQDARWPPLRMRVLRDTTVRRGAAAAKVVRRLRIASVVLFVLALVMLALAWRMGTLPR